MRHCGRLNASTCMIFGFASVSELKVGLRELDCTHHPSVKMRYIRVCIIIDTSPSHCRPCDLRTYAGVRPACNKHPLVVSAARQRPVPVIRDSIDGVDGGL